MKMKNKRRLPVLIEDSIGSVQALRTEIASKFEMEVRTQLKRTTCTKGCASCCYHPVTISIFEGVLLYRWLVDRHLWTTKLREKLKDTADRQYGTSYEVWLMALIPCPLLTDQKECSVYEARPFSCRTYYSAGDPHYCHPHRLGPLTRIVDRTLVANTFHAEQEKILRRHQLQFLTMPVGTALLLAEQLCNEDIDLGAIDRFLYQEYVDKG